MQPAWYSPNGFPGFNANVMPDNSIQFAPSPSYPKPQGRGNSTGGNSNSGGYSKSNHRGRGRGGGINADRSQQGDNRGKPQVLFLHFIQEQSLYIVETIFGHIIFLVFQEVHRTRQATT